MTEIGILLLGIILVIFIPFPFIFRNYPKSLLLYSWFITIILGYMFFYGLYEAIILNPRGWMSGFSAGIAVLLTPFFLIPLVIVMILKKLYETLWKKYLYLLLVFIFVGIVLFQGFLLLSAVKAYTIAQEMNAMDIDDESFYSPTVKRISIYAGKPYKRYYWSYHRMEYVNY